MEFTRDRSNGTISISQKSYIEDVLDRFDSTSITPRRIPMQPDLQLWESDAPRPNEGLQKRYQELVGCLTYLVTCTRYDIAYSVGVLARFCSNPAQVHMEAAQRVLAYLACTKQFALTIGGKASKMRPAIELFTDSDHAGDKETRKSVTGIMVFVFGALVYWKSKKIPSITKSSWESEYVAPSQGASQVVWIRMLLGQLGYSIPTDREGVLDLGWVRTKEMPADMLTKALPRKTYEHLRLKGGLHGRVGVRQMDE